MADESSLFKRDGRDFFALHGANGVNCKNFKR